MLRCWGLIDHTVYRDLIIVQIIGGRSISQIVHRYMVDTGTRKDYNVYSFKNTFENADAYPKDTKDKQHFARQSAAADQTALLEPTLPQGCFSVRKSV